MLAPNTFKLKAFRLWARSAAYENVFVYHREPMERDAEVFSYARKLHDAGMVFLFERRIDGGRFEKCARRTPVKAHSALDKVSRDITVEPSTDFLAEKEHA